MFRRLVPLVVALLVTGPAPAADRPAKEPSYQTNAPKYGRLAFGPGGQERVWLVWDGESLYVDRDGRGDLTGPAARVTAQKPHHGGPREETDGYTFEVGDLTPGGRT